MKKKYQLSILVASSALLLSSAFFLPMYCAPCVFFFLIPLFYCSIKYPESLTYKQGFLWGVIFFATHFAGFAHLCIEHGQGPLKFIAGIFIIFYFSLHPLAWFSITTYCANKYKNSHLWVFVCWIVVSFLFFYFYKYYSMRFFGIERNGYCFALPLLALAEYPQLLTHLATIGESGLLLLLLVSQCAVAYAFAKKEYAYLLGVMALGPFFLRSSLNNDIPDYVTTLGYIQPYPKTTALYSIEQALDLGYQIDALIDTHPKIKHIIMPEASIRVPINCYPELIEVLTEYIYDKNINLFIGAYRAENEKNYNSLYLIRHGAIAQVYDKKLHVPFMEYIPFPWHHISGCRELFLKDRKEFERSKEPVKELCANDQLRFIPCICSELFFGDDEIFKKDSNDPILVVSNEMWFTADYLRHLMLLYARYKAMQYQKEVIFVCHSQAYWINKNNGSLISLQK